MHVFLFVRVLCVCVLGVCVCVCLCECARTCVFMYMSVCFQNHICGCSFTPEVNGHVRQCTVLLHYLRQGPSCQRTRCSAMTRARDLKTTVTRDSSLSSWMKSPRRRRMPRSKSAGMSPRYCDNRFVYCCCTPSNMPVHLGNGSLLDNCTCCHIGREAADQTCCLTQSQYTDTGPVSPMAGRPAG